MTFGKVLHLLRKQGDLKQEDIAHKIGVQKNTISNYENNVSKPHYEQLVKLCNLFKVDPNYLMQDDPLFQQMLFALLKENILHHQSLCFHT